VTLSNGAGIVALGAYTPRRVFTNDEWSRYVDTSDEWIRTRTGIERRRVAAEDETTATLAIEAARQAIQRAGLEARDLDEIVVATDTQEIVFPDTACFVQHAIGAREVPAYTLGGSGCAGFIQALDLAASRVRDGGPSPVGVGGAGKRVLVIGVEVLTKIMDWNDRNTCVLFGDAAAAAVVSADSPKAELLAAVCGTDGSQIDILKLEVGGIRSPVTPERLERREHHNIVMHGREVFRHAVGRMTQACEEVLAKVGMTADDVDLVVPHQANLRIIRGVAKSLEVSMDKVYTNVQEYGNTGSASVPLALYEAEQQGRVGPGSVVLLTAFGAGFHWAAAALRYRA
jgi:3-oxoacyl-[acyl-carrier-protein] synthase-3